MQNAKLTPSEILAAIDSNRMKRPALENPFVEPKTKIQLALSTCWCEILGVQNVGILDNFFMLGGDSLHMTLIVSRMRERFSIELTFEDFFSFPTIMDLSIKVEALNANNSK